MKSNDIKLIIDNFMNNHRSKAILIDGPWGCGKTYEIKEYIKQNKKKKIYYISLFGLESIDEINTAIYNESNKGKIRLRKFANKGLTVLSKAISAIPRVGSIVDGLEFQLEQNNKHKKNITIVIDDIERLSNKISYTDLLGYINSLFLSECKVICFISSSNIGDREKDYDDFKEKIFDRIYQITDVNHDVIKNMFPKNTDLDDRIYDLFESNLRIANRVSIFYESIILRLKNNKELSEDKIEHSILLKACIYCIKICLLSKKYEVDKDNKIYFDYYSKVYGTEITNNWYYYKNAEESKDDFSFSNFSSYVLALTNIFQNLNYDEFDLLYRNNSNNSVDILDKELFYLSSENKNKYYEAFLKKLYDENSKFDRLMTKQIISILHSDLNEFSTNDIEQICNKILLSNYHSVDSFMIEFCGIEDDPLNLNKCKLFIEKLEKCFNEKNKKRIVDDFNNYQSNSDYNKMIDFIEKVNLCDTNEKKEFLKYFLENNMFFPNLEGDIEELEWHYCHIVAKFIRDNHQAEYFINFAKEKCRGTENATLIERFYALIYYKINPNFNVDDLK